MIERILFKLKWCAGGEWSTPIKPHEADQLLRYIERLEDDRIARVMKLIGENREVLGRLAEDD